MVCVTNKKKEEDKGMTGRDEEHIQAGEGRGMDEEEKEEEDNNVGRGSAVPCFVGSSSHVNASLRGALPSCTCASASVCRPHIHHISTSVPIEKSEKKGVSMGEEEEEGGGARRVWCDDDTTTTFFFVSLARRGSKDRFSARDDDDDDETDESNSLRQSVRRKYNTSVANGTSNS